MTKSPTPKDIDALLRSKVRDVPDYPKPGIMFKDITPLLKDANSFNVAINAMAKSVSHFKFDYIVGIEARGFILGSALALNLSKGFVPIRKKGKLPYKKISKSYALEYGTETIEMHEDALERGSSVLIVDDLLATGGTAKAGSELVRQMGADVSTYSFLVELTFLKGRNALKDANVESIIKY